MKKTLLLVTLSFALIRCADDANTSEKITGEDCNATTPATIRDLTGLDGCGFVFELNDGTRLESVKIFSCGTPSSPDFVLIDPLANFDIVDGKKVLIDYTVLENYVSACMVGPGVIINCIKEASYNGPSE